MSDKLCAICLDSVNTDDANVILKCKHEFHDQCINTWISEHHNCPVCRQPILPDGPDMEFDIQFNASTSFDIEIDISLPFESQITAEISLVELMRGAITSTPIRESQSLTHSSRTTGAPLIPIEFEREDNTSDERGMSSDGQQIRHTIRFRATFATIPRIANTSSDDIPSQS